MINHFHPYRRVVVASVEEWSMDAVGPGTFETAVMEPGFTLSYGEGWVPLMPESKNQLNIEIPESSELGCAPCALLGVSAAQADEAEDVVAFATAEGLELSDPEEVEVDGIIGQRYEVIRGEGYIFESEFAAFGVDSADGPARFTVLEAGGRVIVIHELAMPDGGAVVVDPVAATFETVEESGPVASLGFARNGALLVLVGIDGTVGVWETVRSELVGTLWSGDGTAPSSLPWYEAITDSVWVATSGTILQFSLDPDRWVDRVCDLVGRELTPQEWDRYVPGGAPHRDVCD